MAIPSTTTNFLPPPPPQQPGGENERLFNAVTQQGRFEKLHDRFKKKDFVTENRFWRFAAFLASIIINLVSIAAGFYAAHNLFIKFGAGEFASLALSFVLLALIEVARRKAADSIWDKWFNSKSFAVGFVVLNVVLLTVATLFGGYGVNAKVYDSAPPPPVVTDSVLMKMESELAALRADNETAKRTKWRGTVTVDAQRTIKNNSKAIAALTSSINERRARQTAKQDETDTNHNQQIGTRAIISVCIFVALEIAFQVCFAFMSYYDWREYLLRTEQGQKTVAHLNTPTPMNLPPHELARLMNNVSTGGAYPLNIVNPAFVEFMQPQTPQTQQPQTPQTTPQPVAPFASENPFGKRTQSEKETPQTLPANDTKTIYVPTDITVLHIDGTTGKKKWLNITQVRANLSANKTHLSKATDPERRAHYTKIVEYWEGKLAELVTQYQKLKGHEH